MKRPGYYTVNADGREALLAQQINQNLEDINSRINDLEHTITKRRQAPEISRSTKSALLYELGIMEILLGLGISQKKISALLSLLLDASEVNIEKDLSKRHSADAPFKNEEAYSSLKSIAERLELEELEKKALDRLKEIEKEKGKEAYKRLEILKV